VWKQLPKLTKDGEIIEETLEPTEAAAMGSPGGSGAASDAKPSKGKGKGKKQANKLEENKNSNK